MRPAGKLNLLPPPRCWKANLNSGPREAVLPIFKPIWSEEPYNARTRTLALATFPSSPRTIFWRPNTKATRWTTDQGDSRVSPDTINVPLQTTISRLRLCSSVKSRTGLSEINSRITILLLLMKTKHLMRFLIRPRVSISRRMGTPLRPCQEQAVKLL
jgi:hypothetical protein